MTFRLTSSDREVFVTSLIVYMWSFALAHPKPPFSHTQGRRLMGRGTRHTVTGVLRWSGREFVLAVDGGGVWRLDVPSVGRARRLLDQTVTVEGLRSEFDLLDVETLRAGGKSAEPDARRRFWWWG